MPAGFALVANEPEGVWIALFRILGNPQWLMEAARLSWSMTKPRMKTTNQA